MAQMFYERDCSLDYLAGKKIAIVGYGSQGHAHALNLKDSGCDVVVALYEGSKSWKKAEDAGLTVMTTAEAASLPRGARCVEFPRHKSRPLPCPEGSNSAHRWP